MSDNSVYLPQQRNDLKENLYRIKMKMSYRVWWRKLRQFGANTNGGSQILDVGCGPGYLLYCLSKWFPQAQLYGHDMAKDLLAYAGQMLPECNFSMGGAEQLPFDDNQLDIVFCTQVVEHMENPEEFFVEANRVIKPGGFLLIATPNITGIPARLLGDKWPGYRFDHISLAPPDFWRTIQKKHNFEILSEGTTSLTGISWMRKFPLSLINWTPLILFGYMPWAGGESYMSIARLIDNGE